MSPVQDYKKKEGELVDRLLRVFANIGGASVSVCRGIVQKGKQRFTVMFIPHSEKKIFNFQISVFTLMFIFLLAGLLLVAFVVFSTHFTSANRHIVTVTSKLDTREETLQTYRDQMTQLDRTRVDFQQRLDAILKIASTAAPTGFLEQGIGGDLSTLIYDVDEDEQRLTRDLRELGSLNSYLGSVIPALDEFYQFIFQMKELLFEIPTLHPVEGGKGRITNFFGPAEHPFERVWYLHTGVDIAWNRGTPIRATADGTVQEVDNNDGGLGLYVKLRHPRSFSTRYGHLDKVTVVEGQV